MQDWLGRYQREQKPAQDGAEASPSQEREGEKAPLPKRKTLGRPPSRPLPKGRCPFPLQVYKIKAQPAGNWWCQIPACADVELFERLPLAFLGTSMLTIEGNQTLLALAKKAAAGRNCLACCPLSKKAPL
ncbi:hypothetical protein DSO57_1024583 [Entomophthora muscae]|uniref:Uncharacterized protein n=1 Tax=Entomophthora muscae TaxID=34485 RepID=A0ACC2TQ32_9FUNG|nr:hypothetical protein DSO57_1024583 [Entomophthora muscae]